ncbi:hypothetical protein JCM16814_34490 [Desulfobaculum senezii]|jgi:Na+/phosphate symporter
MPGFNLFLLSIPCMFAGAFLSKELNLHKIGTLVLTFGIMLMCMFWFAGGIITAFKNLEHTPVYQVNDGSNNVKMTLKLGAFSYTVIVPETKEEVAK